MQISTAVNAAVVILYHEQRKRLYTAIEPIKDGKTCKEIAPKLKRKLAEMDDPVLKGHKRLYKMHYSPAERYENRTDLRRERMPNDLTFDEFYLWSAYAGSERRRYVAGEITVDEFLRNTKMEPHGV